MPFAFLFFFCGDLTWNDHQAQLANYIQYRALLEGWTSHMWSKYTGVLIWKTQNPWTGLRGQFYDHLLDQTAGFYGCRCAAEPIHVQLNLATYFIEVISTPVRVIIYEFGLDFEIQWIFNIRWSVFIDHLLSLSNLLNSIKLIFSFWQSKIKG